jgi:MarR-like DNA-binding transcriptional regulator SgrR of sgrS sRNA
MRTRILAAATLAVSLAPLAACRGRVAPLAPAPVPPAAPAPPPVPQRMEAAVPEEGGEGAFALEEPFTSAAASKLATSSDRMLRGLAFHGLSRFAPSGAVEPELAVRWESLRGGAEWIFHLRPDTAFANGRYLEARHVAASWERLIADPAARYAFLLEALKGFDDVASGEAPHAAGLILEDGLTLRVVLERPVRDLPWRLAHPALGVSAFGEDEQGVGPFEIWGTPQAQRIILRSNPEYFRHLPHLDEIAFLRGEAAKAERLAEGKLDFAVLPRAEAPTAGPAARVFTHAVPRTYVLGLNRSAAPFSRPDAARAFLASLDREALRGAAGAGKSFIPETLVNALSPGPRRAAAPGPPGVSAGPLGRLDLLVPEADAVAASLAAKLQGEILRAGGRVALHAVKLQDISGALARGEYHLFVLPFIPSSPSFLIAYEELMRWNRSLPGSLAGQARALANEEDPGRLAQGLKALDASLQEGGYLVPLVSLERRFLVRAGLCGLRHDPVGMLDWTQVWATRSPADRCD